jgi:RNA polymerase sigma-70 factor (ECF subfamily)
MTNPKITDQAIVELFLSRDETAMRESQDRYAAYCQTIARRILGNEQDAEECVNDTWLSAWQSIPPHHPQNLAGFLGKLTRTLAIDRLRAQNRLKRGGGEVAVQLDELADCVPDSAEHPDAWSDDLALRETLQTFLAEQPKTTRTVFIQRYFYAMEIKEIAREMGWGESRTKMQLLRTREALRARLQEEQLL